MRNTVKKNLLRPLPMLIAGLCLGVASRMLDIYTQNLGEMFSQMAIWILLGTAISVYSATPWRAAGNILPFCLGMLAAYYAVASISHGVYGAPFIVGWTIFAACSPVMAYFAWMSKEKGVFPKVIAVGIVAVSVLSSIVLFDGLRGYDFVIDALLIYLLFFRKVERRSAPRRKQSRRFE